MGKFGPLISILCFSQVAYNAEPVHEYDLIQTKLIGIDNHFYALQHAIIETLHTQTIPTKKGLYTFVINGNSYYLATYTGPNKPITPHISLKLLVRGTKNIMTLLTQKREDFNNMPLSMTPQSIRLTNFLTISGSSDPDKIFIALGLQDNPTDSLEYFAKMLDIATDMPRHNTFLPHITLAKVWPAAKDCRSMPHEDYATIQNILAGTSGQIDTSQSFPIESIDYVFFNEATILFWKPPQLPGDLSKPELIITYIDQRIAELSNILATRSHGLDFRQIHAEICGLQRQVLSDIAPSSRRRKLLIKLAHLKAKTESLLQMHPLSDAHQNASKKN